MTLSVIIRPATTADARAIAKVHVETWRAAYAGLLPDKVMVGMSVDGKARSWRDIINRRGPRDSVIVASVTGEGIGPLIVGFASCGPAAPHRAHAKGEIYTLYVLPDWQEQGLGRALLSGCFRTLRQHGIDSAFLWVLAENPSRFFYEAMGGKQAGHREEQLWGTTVQETAYRWPDLASLPAGLRAE